MLKITDIHKKFGDNVILKGIDLEVNKGTWLPKLVRAVIAIKPIMRA